MKIEMIPVTKIRPDPNQPRQKIDEEKVASMAESLKSSGVGIINAIEIDKGFMIITGELRWRSASLAGLKEVPCKIIKPKDRFLRQVIENIHQGVMTDYDTACALRKLLKSAPASTARKVWNDEGFAQLSRILGVSSDYVCEKLSIFKESKKIQQAVKDGKITSGVIKGSKRAPKEYRQELKEKYMRKEIPTIDSVGEVASAIKRRPDKAREILDKDYSKMTGGDVIESVRKLSPRSIDNLEENFEESMRPADLISGKVSDLQDLLNKNPTASLPRASKSIVGMSLMGLLESVREYLDAAKSTKQLTQAK